MESLKKYVSVCVCAFVCVCVHVCEFCRDMADGWRLAIGSLRIPVGGLVIPEGVRWATYPQAHTHTHTHTEAHLILKFFIA